KGVLTRSDGHLLAQAVREHETSSPRPGHVEHDAQEVWWRDFTELAAELLAQAPAGERLAGVGVSGIGPCLLPADGDDAPLRPAILYGVDTRAGDQVAELTARYGQDEIIRRCGSALSSQALGPKFAWVRQREPEVYGRMRRWYMAGSYLVR